METISFKQISSKQLKSTNPLLTVIIDGVKLYEHSTLERPLLIDDEDEFEKQKITKNDIITEELYHIIYYLQNTALNLAGLQRVLLRTCDKQIISIDPRLKMPIIFDDYLKLMWRFMQDRRICSLEKDTEIMRFVKSDLSHTLPPGARRFGIYVDRAEMDNIKKPSDFLHKEPTAVFIHLNPTQKPQDELMESTFCISTDNLAPVTAISRVVKEMETKAEIW